MLKKLLAIIAFLFYAAASFAANVDVNTANAAELDALKGIGPAMSKRIIDARQQGGPFKDWGDFISRVKGIGNKNAAKFSSEGMTVGGTSFQGAPAKSSTAATSTEAAPEPQADASAAKKHGGRRSKKAAASAAQ